MSPYLISFYIVTILVRLQDWWSPVLNWQLVTFASAATALFGFPELMARWPFVWNRIPQMKAAIAFLVGVVLSFLSKFWLAGMWLAFQEMGKVIFFFMMILILIKRMTDYKILLWTVVLCLSWLGIHSIMQLHTGYGFGHKEALYRVRKEYDEGDNVVRVYVRQSMAFGTFEDPNDLCTALIFAIPLFYVLYKTAANPLQQAVCLAGVATCAYGAYATNSRGGVVAIFGMVSAYIITRIKGFKRYLTIAVAVSLVTVLAPSRFSGGLMGKDRAVLWGNGIDMFRANPIFGVGYKNFADNSEEHLVCHNTYIHTLAELGLVGYLPLFLIFYLTVIQLRRAINAVRSLNAKDYILLSGAYSAVIGYLTSLYFVSRQYEHFLYLVMSIAITIVIIMCDRYGLHSVVFGNTKKDVQRGLYMGLVSVVVFYFTVRMANLLG